MPYLENIMRLAGCLVSRRPHAPLDGRVAVPLSPWEGDCSRRTWIESSNAAPGLVAPSARRRILPLRMSDYTEILTIKKDRHAIIQLNRPEKMNALSHKLRSE